MGISVYSENGAFLSCGIALPHLLFSLKVTMLFHLISPCTSHRHGFLNPKSCFIYSFFFAFLSEGSEGILINNSFSCICQSTERENARFCGFDAIPVIE